MKVFIIAALTADGFIGRDANHLADWTSAGDKKLFVRLTKEAGTMVMGSRTFETIGRPLPGRKTIVYTPDPSLYEGIDVETTNRDPKDLVVELSKKGQSQLAVCGGASIYDLFIRSGVVDELFLTINSKLFGKGISIFNKSLDIDLALLNTEKLDDNTVLLHYAVKNE